MVSDDHGQLRGMRAEGGESRRGYRYDRGSRGRTRGCAVRGGRDPAEVARTAEAAGVDRENVRMCGRKLVGTVMK